MTTERFGTTMYCIDRVYMSGSVKFEGVCPPILNARVLAYCKCVCIVRVLAFLSANLNECVGRVCRFSLCVFLLNLNVCVHIV